jgi:hypothetical protein
VLVFVQQVLRYMQDESGKMPLRSFISLWCIFWIVVDFAGWSAHADYACQPGGEAI